MPNINADPERVRRRKELFDIAVRALEREGWRVERVSGLGKSSVRRITKGRKSLLVSIRTTQDQWIAFPRDTKNNGWVTLSDMDAVVAVSVDDRDEPKFALVHLIDGDDMRKRFDRAYSARKDAGYVLPPGRGIWVSLYDEEVKKPANRVGAGAGLQNAPIARVPLQPTQKSVATEPQRSNDVGKSFGFDRTITETKHQSALEEKTLSFDTIMVEAKRQIALALGVDSSKIKITVEA